MSDLLEKLGFKKRTHVGISLSSNNFIELVCVDKSTKTISKYASGNIKYNNAIREIIDYDEFIEVLEGLFDEAGLNPAECAVTLNLPNVHFGITAMETEAETTYIIDNLQSEIEDLYIFKRNEPVISYTKLDGASGRKQKNIIYSAIQAKVISKLIEIFDNMNCELVRIDNSYSSLLKTIQFCDRFNNFVQKEERTTILLVTPNSCCSFYMEGNVLIDYNEEPLAVKSFSTEEVYSTISKIGQTAIDKNNPQSMLIISEADEVNAETLAASLMFNGETDFINKSINVNEQFIEISGLDSDIDSNMISYITMEAVGAAVSDYDNFPLNINFLPDDRIPKNIVEVGPYEVDLARFAIISFAFTLLMAVLLSSVVNLIFKNSINSLDDQSTEAKLKVNAFKTKVNKNATEGKDIFPVLKQLIDNNTALITIFNALSTDIPDSVYIKRFVTNEQGGIGIIGEAKTSDAVDAFIKGLKEKNGDLTLSKLSVNTKYDEIPSKIPNGFTFEIKTTTHDIDLTSDTDIKEYESRNKTLNSNQVPQYSNQTNTSTTNQLPPPPVI